MSPDRNRELRRLTLFVAVGTLNTVVCYALYAALIEWAGWDYMLALVADYAVGIVLGFLLHRVSTFADRKHLKRAFRKYAISLIFAFAINAVLLKGIVDSDLLDALAAQFIAMLIATLASYVLQKNWVFRSYLPQLPPENPSEAAPPGVATQ